MNPLVSCIMPTFDRPAFVPLALRWFAAQDYPERELVVVDDGTAPIRDLLPDDPRVRYVALAQRAPIGIKRNIACEAARGELLAHWDDDDWFAPNRLSAQVEVMRDTRIDMCGINSLLYYDLRDGQAWRYVHPRRARPWLSLLMYRRSLWARLRHSATRVGSDTRFVWQVDPQRIATLANRGLNVCLMHTNNVAPKNTRGARWRRVPNDEVVATLGEDWRFYRNGPRTLATAPPRAAPSWHVFIPVAAGGNGIDALLTDLAQACTDTSVSVHVATAADRTLSTHAHTLLERHGWRYRASAQAGRAGHVALFGDAFAAARELGASALFVCLPEDASLDAGFFADAETAWTLATEHDALALTIRGSPDGLDRALWTGFQPVPAGELWRTGRIEDAFIATRAFFAALDFKAPPVPGHWLANTARSEGVRRAASIRLHGAGFRLLRTAEDVVRRRSGSSAAPSSGSMRTLERASPWTVIITTFERPQLLSRLLDDLDQARDAGVDLDVRVYDDASTADYRGIQQRLNAARWRYVRAPRNHGKRRFWIWMSRIFADLRDLPSGRMIAFLQDDVRLCEQFFERAETLWAGIDDPRKATLNVFVDDSRATSPVWTNVLPRRCGAIWRTQWVDGLYVTTRRCLELLDFAVPPVSAHRWDRSQALSSGVGQNISLKLHRAGQGMYRVDRSLLVHVEARSALNPLARSQTPLSAARFIDGEHKGRALRRIEPVHATLATIPARARHLEATVQSLLPQVDRVHVYLNGHDAVPACLQHPRIEVVLSRDHGDRGDAGKFFWASELDGCVLTCDDDIIYPPDYATRLVLALESYHRQAVVGLHGITLRTPVRSYYRDRTLVHCEQALAVAQSVHLLGTGCAAYHTSTLKVDASQFETADMADIWFGLACQRQRMPVVAIARPARWIKLQPVESSIYARYRAHDPQQTALIRSIAQWQLRTPAQR